MKKIITFGLMSLFIYLPVLLSANSVRRFGLAIGANNGGAERVQLVYAITDAEAFASVMRELGGIDNSDLVLLKEPTAADIVYAMAQLKQQIAEAKNEHSRVEIMFYYSGHADEKGILLGNDRIKYGEIRVMLEDLDADVRVAIVDSCSSGALTRLKGGVMLPPFMIDVSTDMQGYAYLTSSSADEASQESDTIGGSFFTHYLISGLRGGADANNDGKVTLNETYQFAFDETLARTENTFAGPQHPRYDIQMIGSGDFVLTDIRGTSASLQLGGEIEGTVFVCNQDNDLMVELNKEEGHTVELGLEPGIYTVTIEKDNALYQTKILLNDGMVSPLDSDNLRPVERLLAVNRGDTQPAQNIQSQQIVIITEPAATITVQQPEPVNEAEYVYAPFNAFIYPSEERKIISSIALNPGVMKTTKLIGIGASFGGNIVEEKMTGALFSIGFNKVGNDSFGFIYSVGWNKVSGNFKGIINSVGWNTVEGTLIGLMLTTGWNSIKGDLLGAQVSTGFNSVNGDMIGVQVTAGFNMALGNVRGAQISGGFNKVEGHTIGAQIAGGFNNAINNLIGVQISGGLNRVDGNMFGVQISAINIVKGNIDGAQIGLVNSASSISGGQVGLINVGGVVNGIQLGLINIASEMKGIPIGLINISKNGYNNIVVSFNESGFYNLGATLGTEHVYSTFMAGMNTDKTFMSAGAGVGLHFTLGKLFINTEGIFDAIIPLNKDNMKNVSVENVNVQYPAVNFVTRIRASVGIQIFKRFAVAAGFSYNIMYAPNGDFDNTISPVYWPGVGNETPWVNPNYKSWPGFFVEVILL